MRTLIKIGATTLVLVTLAACGSNNVLGEQYEDAPVSGRNDDPALIINMPDAFPNVAFKCFNGNGIYVTRGDSVSGRDIAVVASDPACAK